MNFQCLVLRPWMLLNHQSVVIGFWDAFIGCLNWFTVISSCNLKTLRGLGFLKVCFRRRVSRYSNMNFVFWFNYSTHYSNNSNIPESKYFHVNWETIKQPSQLPSIFYFHVESGKLGKDNGHANEYISPTGACNKWVPSVPSLLLSSPSLNIAYVTVGEAQGREQERGG